MKSSKHQARKLQRSCKFEAPKARILSFVQKLPDDSNYAQIAERVALVARIYEAQEQFARGESFSAEEIIKELPDWIEGRAKSLKAYNPWL